MTEPMRPGEMRVSDVDRERVVERLRFAQGEGRLDLYEFDERAAQAYAARTVDDLRRVTADLPDPGDPAAYPGRHGYPGAAIGPTQAVSAAGVVETRGDRRPARRGTALRVIAGTWFTVSFINLVIWALVSVSTGAMVYPWWIWVAGPWGAALFAGWLSSRMRADC